MLPVTEPDYLAWLPAAPGEKPLVVVFTGAGVSAESGIRTFRDHDGLWENHRVEDVAHINAWRRNPELVLRFYNERRAQLGTVQPNPAHEAIAALQPHANVIVITQNVDDLHERAGSQRVLHLHGRLNWVRSTADESLLFDVGAEPIRLGDKCPKGSQLRPHIVWFGEEVPNYNYAAVIARQADAALVIGTSMVVTPAAWLVEFIPQTAPLWYINPDDSGAGDHPELHIVAEKAGTGVPKAIKNLRERLKI